MKVVYGIDFQYSNLNFLWGERGWGGGPVFLIHPCTKINYFVYSIIYQTVPI